MSDLDLVEDGFGRIGDSVRAAVGELSAEQLMYRPGGTGNSVAWLVWHLSRVQDDHIASAAGSEQVWTAQGWAVRFGLNLPVEDTGYGHTSEDVDAVTVPSAELLLGYFDAVAARTTEYLRSLSPADLDRVVDPHWDPPVTLAVRLISVLSDDLQHAGQAGYVAGLASAR